MPAFRPMIVGKVLRAQNGRADVDPQGHGRGEAI
jgi:hypothetical protein